MLFIDALNRLGPQTTEKKPTESGRKRAVISNRDSVDLSMEGHQVKEVHLDSKEKTPLNAQESVFANLIEHILNHVLTSDLSILSPDELGLNDKNWQVYLQVPPRQASTNRRNQYQAPKPVKVQPSKQIIFHIPVKPSYGTPVNMTVLVSAPIGSPDTPDLFKRFPKENTLTILTTPYPPEFLQQQNTHHHIVLDQDGESDQLSPVYAFANQQRLLENHNLNSATFGMRVWRNKDNQLTPVVLGDSKIGLLYTGNYHLLDSKAVSEEDRAGKTHNLYEKA
ncbi:hypothetical protein [Marinomonas epiphytica]